MPLQQVISSGYIKDQFFIKKLCPRTRPKKFLNCFALELSVFKTKQLRNS